MYDKERKVFVCDICNTDIKDTDTNYVLRKRVGLKKLLLGYKSEKAHICNECANTIGRKILLTKNEKEFGNNRIDEESGGIFSDAKHTYSELIKYLVEYRSIRLSSSIIMELPDLTKIELKIRSHINNGKAVFQSEMVGDNKCIYYIYIYDDESTEYLDSATITTQSFNKEIGKWEYKDLSSEIPEKGLRIIVKY